MRSKFRVRGLTLGSIIVGTFIMALLGTMLISIQRVQKSQLTTIQGRMTTFESSEVLFAKLEKALEATSADGFHISTDGKTFAIQKIESVSLSGSRVWGSSVQIYHLAETKALLESGEIEISELGISHEVSTPSNIDDAQISEAVLKIQNQGAFQVLSRHVKDLEVQISGPLSVEIKLTTEIDQNGKVDRMSRARSFFFLSSSNV